MWRGDLLRHPRPRSAGDHAVVTNSHRVIVARPARGKGERVRRAGKGQDVAVAAAPEVQISSLETSAVVPILFRCRQGFT